MLSAILIEGSKNGDEVPAAGLNLAQIALAKAHAAKDLNIDDRITKFKDI